MAQRLGDAVDDGVHHVALASIDLGEFEVAEAHYRESLAIEPQASIYNDLGFVLARQGLPEEAAEMYRKSLELEPDSATAHYNLAASLAGSGELTEAETHLRAAIGLKPSSPAYAALSKVLTEMGRTDEAREALASAQALEQASNKVQ